MMRQSNLEKDFLRRSAKISATLEINFKCEIQET